MARKGGVRRRWHLDLHGIRREGTKESGFSYRGPDGNLITDEKILQRIGRLRVPPAWQEVRIARGDGIAIFRGHQHLLDGIYPYLLMGIHAIFGFTPLLPKLLNGGLAALCAVLIFGLAREMFRPPVALFAGLAAAVLPTLVIWSVASLKESLVLLLCVFGIIGGFMGGLISDKVFHSRRGPPSALLSGFMFVMAIVMAFCLFRSPFTVGVTAVLISMAVIGVHSLMSGTAAADFGGRKAGRIRPERENYFFVADVRQRRNLEH